MLKNLRNSSFAGFYSYAYFYYFSSTGRNRRIQPVR